MVELFDQFFLFGSGVGFLLACYVMVSKSTHRGNPVARYYLAAAILVTVLNLLGGKDFEHSNLNWILYFFYPLIGLLYLLYAQKLLNLNIQIKKWCYSVGLFLVIHITILLSLADLWKSYDFEDLVELTVHDFFIISDYYIALFLNSYAVYFVLKKIRSLSIKEFKEKDHLNFVWLKKIFGTITVIYFALLILIMFVTVLEILFNPIVMGIEMNKFTAAIYYFVVKTGAYVKIEGFLTALFILSIAIWSMRIPVFASYQPIVLEEEKEVKKYAKSTLKEDQSDEIWNQIKELMEDKYLYRNPTLRLSDLVQEIGKPLPHVSQVINERMDMTFLDFVNQYRVKEAKELLCDEKVKSMTILAIAYEVGFNSKTTFYTSFKKVTGQTPSEYRKSKKK